MSSPSSDKNNNQGPAGCGSANAKDFTAVGREKEAVLENRFL